MTTTWHVPEDDLRAYATGELAPPALWSADAHLLACAHCRSALAALTDPGELTAGWARLEAELDAPRPGRGESLLTRAGVPEYTARLLTATPVLRASWLLAVVLVLGMGALVGYALGTPLPMLATAPVLPLAGVAMSFVRGLDPTYEMAVVAPMHTFRLLMVRTVAVLATTLPAALAASLAVPSFWGVVIGWLLPALALTCLGLALMPWLGPIAAPTTLATCWVGALAANRFVWESTLFPLTMAGRLSTGLAAVLAALALAAARDRFDVVNPLNFSFRSLTRRLS